MVQFLAQCVAVVFLRRRHVEGHNLTFRMPLYPLPAIVAFLGWLLILISSGVSNILFAFAITLAGVAAFLYKSRQEQAWPFETL
jgi:amino acid transporter